jgi:hypothetical protein
MTTVTANQPDGTPTWVDLGVPDVGRAAVFYQAVFGWEINAGPAETGYYSMCLLRGKAVAALAQPSTVGEGQAPQWTMYFAAADPDGTAKRIADAGGEMLMPPMDVMSFGRMALAADPTGARFGLWEGRDHLGCELVNEPGALVRNDLATTDPKAARAFYSAIFDYTVEGNPDMAGADFTFLRRPDGHEIGGIMGVPDAPVTMWNTTFEVADTDAAVRAATEAGGTVANVEDMMYGRIAALRDPFGTEFSVITRAV